MSIMKALVIHPFMRVLYGAERVCLNLIKALLEENIEVGLITDAKKIEDLGRSIGLTGLNKVIKIPYIQPPIEINKFVLYQRIIWKEISKRLIKLNKFNDSEMEFLTLDPIFLFGVGKKKIAYIHYPEFLLHQEIASSKFKKIWRLYYIPSIKYIRNQINKIDLLICNSNFTKFAILKKWGRHAEVVYPPVDVETIKPSLKKDFVVTVGRFSKEKNYETIINVAKLLPNTKFFIIGGIQEEEYYEKISRIKPKNVILLPNLSNRKKNLLLSKAKVYLHSMVNEHFGISIIESMAAGCIPIVHNSGGPKEIVINIGYLYNDVYECRDYIKNALEENIDISKLVRRAKDFSSDKFRKNIIYELKKMKYL